MGATPFLSEVATEWEQPRFQEKTVNQNQEKTTATREVALLHRWAHTPKVRDFWRGLAASTFLRLLPFGRVPLKGCFLRFAIEGCPLDILLHIVNCRQILMAQGERPSFR